VGLAAFAVFAGIVAPPPAVAHPPTETEEQVPDGTEPHQVLVGHERVVSHYETYMATVYITIGTKQIQVRHHQCWTAANPGPFGATGCYTWYTTKRVPNTFPIQVEKQRAVYKSVPKYETQYRTKYKTVTVLTHDDHYEEPTATPTPVPTATAVATPTPTATPTPVPTATAVATPTPTEQPDDDNDDDDSDGDGDEVVSCQEAVPARCQPPVPVSCPAGYRKPPLPDSPVIDMHNGSYISPDDPDYGRLITDRGIGAEWQEHATAKGCYTAVRTEGRGISLSPLANAVKTAIHAGKAAAEAVVAAYHAADIYVYNSICGDDSPLEEIGAGGTLTGLALQRVKDARALALAAGANGAAVTAAALWAACLVVDVSGGAPDNNKPTATPKATPTATPIATPRPTATVTATPEPEESKPPPSYDNHRCIMITSTYTICYYRIPGGDWVKREFTAPPS
jgi:hypothetical protein